MLPRKQYLNRLISLKDNGRGKVITGLRRSGKSVLLFTLYRDHLLNEGVGSDQIIGLALDSLPNAKYRNPIELDKHIREQMTDPGKQYYIFIDEIQFVSEIQNPYVNDPTARISFIDVVLGLMQIRNADVYVTGSNSKMLSSDILTQFRDRGDEIRVWPLSFSEFLDAYQGDKRGAWQDYYTYGGMPALIPMESHEEKSSYLRSLFSRTYIRDILERHQILNETEVLDILLSILASGTGSLTNPTRISNTFLSENQRRITPDTIELYLSYFIDAFLIQKAERYDVKGNKYIKTPAKYYFSDPGLRNAKLNFRQVEETHLMENVLYTDLVRRGFDVDVGVVEYNTKDSTGKSIRKQLEVDFVINRGSNRFYIQSALDIADLEKKDQETAPLRRIPDSFRKIVVVGKYMNPWNDDYGIQYVGIEQFLTNESILS